MLRFRSQSGQAIVEQIVLWPVLVLLTLGAVQMAFLYRDKAVFNDAVFRAAREGALNNAYITAMNKKLVEGLVPLYQKSAATEGAYYNSLSKAYADNSIDPLTGHALGLKSGIKIEVLSPNRSIFAAFSSTMYELQEGCEQDLQPVSNGFDRTRCRTRGEMQYKQIPNAALESYVSTAALSWQKNVVVAGENVQMNIQDANLLKIRAHWCAPLIVPFGSFALYQWKKTWASLYAELGGNTHPHWSVCKARTDANALLSKDGKAVRTLYIPISSDTVVRMQSPVRCQGDEMLGRPARCINLN